MGGCFTVLPFLRKCIKVSPVMASTTTTTSLASRIRKTRIRSNMTQAQFARKLGVRQQKLSEWENGKRLRAVFDAMTLLKVIR